MLCKRVLWMRQFFTCAVTIISFVDAHMEATWRGSLLGLVLRWGGFGGLVTVGKDNFLSDGTGESTERVREKFSAFK